MHDARAKSFAGVQTALMEPSEQKGIGQGTPMVPRARMHHHTLRLINHRHLLIFIDEF
jgi:hypothetical protein